MSLYRRVMEADARIAGLRLGALRRRRGVSQTLVADALDVSQPNVSRLELQEDLRLSTLARYVAALGGDLELRATFGDETISLLPPSGTERSSEDSTVV
jgi:transcriptional regulator with XRE-family HTH domain